MTIRNNEDDITGNMLLITTNFFKTGNNNNNGSNGDKSGCNNHHQDNKTILNVNHKTPMIIFDVSLSLSPFFLLLYCNILVSLPTRVGGRHTATPDRELIRRGKKYIY